MKYKPDIFLWWVSQNDLLGVSNLLSLGTDIDINVLREDGLAALHIAAMQGNSDMCKLLVNEGANINQLTDFQYPENTPLHLSLKNGHMDASLTLLNLGADVTITDNEDRNIYHCVVIGENVDLCENVLKFVGNKVDINFQDDSGSNPLRTALSAGDPNENLCRLLLKYGALDIVDNDDKKSSQVACEKGLLELSHSIKNAESLLVLRSANEIQRFSPRSSVRILPRDLTRLVAKMLIEKNGDPNQRG